MAHLNKKYAEGAIHVHFQKSPKNDFKKNRDDCF